MRLPAGHSRDGDDRWLPGQLPGTGGAASTRDDASMAATIRPFKGLYFIGKTSFSMWFHYTISVNVRLCRINNVFVYAKYDKLPVYISYRYVGADGDEKYKETKEPVFMLGDATYGDVETYLQNVSAPEESFGDLVFQKWELASYQDADDPLITSNFVFVSASYDKNLGIVSNQSSEKYRFLENNGFLSSSGSIMKLARKSCNFTVKGEKGAF